MQTFCTGAQVVTHTCPPGPNLFTDLVLTCQPAPRGFRRIGSESIFGVDLDDVSLERFENNNVDTAGYGADGSRRGE